MKRSEAKIRDYLASNIDFISEDFEVIQKEYYLKNSVGTRGFIDILAQDSLHNFVIIEIKRSNQAAREALHEVFKYAGLLRQNLKIKESEIRIYIVSTDWSELLVPFSQVYKTSDYQLEGVKISLGSNDLPEEKEYIQPIEKPLERKISFNKMLYLYEDEESMHKAVLAAKERIEEVGIIDFVLLKVICENQDDLIYPYGIYLAFQQYAMETLRECVTDHLEASDELTDIEDELDENHLIYYLEQIILSKIDTSFCHTLETSSSDGFTSMLESQGWNIIEVFRSGLFDDDPRLKKDEFLISEIKGFKGEGITLYHNQSFSKLKLRLKEIEETSPSYLWNGEFGDNTWFDHIKFVFEKLKYEKAEYDLQIGIYNPRVGILSTLYYIFNYNKFGANNSLEFLPVYSLQVRFKDKDKSSVTYLGRIKWTGKIVAVKDLVTNALNRDAWTYFLASQLRADPLLEMKVMNFLGFSYSTNLFFLNGEQPQEAKSIEIEDGEPYLTELEHSLYLEDFLSSQSRFLIELSELYESFVHIM
jgi:hypothetical protein